MASKQPTCQQLAYLDELKQRLQELRMRQETFMEETAQMLRKIGSDRLIPKIAEASISSLRVPSIQSVEDREAGMGNIKQLIKRFEDLRQTSQHFSDQTMPEELMGVDVRKLLQGYENLIVEGKILQKNWMMLKKTTENCALQTNKESSQSLPKSRKSFRFCIETQSFKDQDQSSQRDFEKSANKPRKVFSKVTKSYSSKHISFCIDSMTQKYDQKLKKGKLDSGKPNRQRFGALVQLALRINPFNKCAPKK